MIARKDSQYQEKRLAFLASDAYAEAYAYVESTLEELLPGCEHIVSIEPGDLLDADLSEFTDFADNFAVREKFYAAVDLSFKVNYRDFDTDAKELADELISRGISGRMIKGEVGGDYYDINAVEKTAELVIIPEV